MAEAPGKHDPSVLPPDIPAPQDDGRARHLTGLKLPDVALPATGGGMVNLSKLKGRTVVYVYPRTGVPGVDPPPGWDQIPGARGCTPQSCGFRDHFAELKALGVAQVFGLSTQDTDYQQEAADRLHLPFPILSDAELNLATGLHLPMFMTSGMTLLARDGAGHRGWQDRQSVLSGVPAGQERRRGHCLAARSLARISGRSCWRRNAAP